MKKQRGFSILDMAVAILIIGVIFAYLIPPIYQALQASLQVRMIEKITLEAEPALIILRNDLQAIEDQNTESLLSLSPLTFKTKTHQITYQLTGQQLTRQQDNNPAETLATSLKGFTVEAYDTQGNKTSLIPDIRYLKMTLQDKIDLLEQVVLLRNSTW